MDDNINVYLFTHSHLHFQKKDMMLLHMLVRDSDSPLLHTRSVGEPPEHLNMSSPFLQNILHHYVLEQPQV